MAITIEHSPTGRWHCPQCHSVGLFSPRDLKPGEDKEAHVSRDTGVPTQIAKTKAQPWDAGFGCPECGFLMDHHNFQTEAGVPYRHPTKGVLPQKPSNPTEQAEVEVETPPTHPGAD